jgi:uncharacterized protein
MRVSELWRFPVKSLQGERVESAELVPHGLVGDREWAIFDETTGFGLTARRAPQLLYATATRGPDGGVQITLPDGTVADDDDTLSSWLGRRVRLRASSEMAARRYENPADAETEAPESWAPFDGLEGAFHDSFPVTLLSTATLGGADRRRFRANVVVDGAGEDDLVDATVQLGEALLQVTAGVPRCVMVTRPQPGGIGTDREVLRRIHRERAGLLSVGGVVVRRGTVALGDEVVAVR